MLNIYDVLGNVVKSAPVFASKGDIDINLPTAGMYFCRMVIDNKVTLSRKIMIVK